MANGFADAGADVTVIAASREVFLIHYGADASLEGQIDPRLDIVRVPFYPDKAWPLMNDWPRLRVTAPGKYAARPDPATERFPEKVYASWLPRVTEALLQVHRRRPISVLIGSGAPYVDNEAAAVVADNYGIPLVLDDRDSFLADVFSGEERDVYEQRRPFFLEWSRRSSELWFVNPPIADWHRKRFPECADRIRVVENGWDPGVVDAGLIPPQHQPHRPLRAGYVGLVPTNFPMGTVLQAWDEVAGSTTDHPELRFVGPLHYEVGSTAWQRAEAAIAQAAHATWAGHVTRDRLAGVYADMDVLLLVKEGGAMVTGGKTYEYAATGLPIAALVDPRSDALRVLSGYPRLHPADPRDPHAAAAAIAAAIADRRSDDGSRLRAAQHFGAQLNRSRMLSEHIRRVLELARP